MSNEISINDYQGEDLEKGFHEVPKSAEEVLNENFEKGLISTDQFGTANETLDVIKGGKRAQVGEMRTWQGKKYKKTQNGWEKVKEKTHDTVTEDFVDEDTGEMVSVDVKVPTPETRAKEQLAKHKAEKSKERNEKKKDKRSGWDSLGKTEDKFMDAQRNVKEAKSDLAVIKQRLENAIGLDQENAHAGSDSGANEYYNDYIKPLEEEVEVATQSLARLRNKSRQILKVLENKESNYKSEY